MVFNIGPDEGTVDVSVGQKSLEWDLYSAESIDYGGGFQLPYVRFVNLVKLSIATVCVCTFLAMGMFAVNVVFAKRMPSEKGTNTRNSAVEFLRFFISITVVLHHFTPYSPSGYLGVDFFFLLSGFFLMDYYAKDATASEDPALAAVKYTKKRYLRLFPYYLLAFFLSNILSVCLWDSRPLESSIMDTFWEITMLEAFGDFTENLLVGPGWYCSALIIAGFFVYFLLSKYRKTYLYIIAPSSLFLIFGWMLHNFGQLNRWLQFDTFISTGTLRGFAEMGLGCISYQIYVVLRAKNWGNKVVNTILELACFSYIVYIIFVAGPSAKDFVCVFAMATLIVSLFLGKSLWSKILDNRLSRFLGWVSIGIYLNHNVLARIPWHKICSHFGLPWATELWIYLLVVIAFSVISTRFVENIERKIKLQTV